MNYRHLLTVLLFSIFIGGCNGNDDNEVKTQSQPVEFVNTKNFEQQSANSNFDLQKQKSEFELTHFEVLDVSESEYDKTPAIAISFSVPIDATVNYSKFIQVIDSSNKIVEGSWILNQSRTRVYFTNIEPRENYQIIVNSKITSITDKRLTLDVKKNLKTNALEPSIRFLNRGNILPKTLTNGLAIESINIAQVDINFHRVSSNNVAQVLSDGFSGYSYYVRNIPEYAELVYTARYSIDVTQNKKMTVNLPIHKVSQLQQPGLYIAVMKAAGSYPYEHQVTSFTISDLALHTRRFNKSVEIHSLNISNGQPQSGVSLEVISRKGNVIARASTDEKGNYRLARFDDDAVIIAQKDNNFAAISFAAPAIDLSEQLNNTRLQNEQELFLYGPRDLYRPGETISINGLLRGVDGETVASVPLKVSIIRPDSRIASEFSWHPQVEGFYQREFPIGKSEPTGEWTFRAKHPSGIEFNYNFSVEEFLPETMKLELISSVNGIANSTTNIQIKAQGDYLYGAPAAGNRIAANMKIKATHYPLAEYSRDDKNKIYPFKDFYFGQSSANINATHLKEVVLDDKKLDEAGSVEWMLPNLWQTYKYPTQVLFEASLFESGGRPVTRRIRQLIWPGDTHIGLRKVFSSEYVEPFKQAEFEIINANSRGELSALGQLEINLIRENTQYYWRANHQGWDYAYNKQNKRVYSRVINSQENRQSISLPVEYGTYRVEIKDAFGIIKNSYQFFAGWSWDNDGDGAITGSRPDKVRLLFNKPSYQAGDIAKVKIISPYAGQALVRIESNKLLWEKQVNLSQLESEINIPVSKDWNRHDLYLSAMVVSKPEQLKSNLEIELPKRALGFEPFRLDRSQNALSIKIEAPELSLPERKVLVKVKLENQLSHDAYVTLAAVDTGVLSLSNYKTPQPYEWFYGQRAYSADIRDSFSYLIKNLKGQNGVLKFGGDAELARGGEQPNTDVQIVSIFSGLVKFDQQGEANVELDLPSFNGELRLMALAFSNEKFGHTDTKMKVRAPLVAEISKPRFLALKDKSQFAFDLQNMSGQQQQLTANLSISGGLETNEISLPLSLKDKEKHTQLFNITANNLSDGNIKLVLLDSNNSIVLQKDWLLGIRAAYPATFKRLRKVLNNGQSFELKQDLIEEFDPHNLQARIEFSNVPPLSSETHLQNLFQYPYGCLEQTSSRAWPLLKIDTSINFLKLNEHATKVVADKVKHINAAIARINGMQRHDGSFGLWSNQSNENHWLSVYALEFLTNAKQAGYSVPNSVINKGIERLQSYIKTVRPSYTERSHYSQNPEHYAVAFRAYAAYLLSNLNQVKLNQLRQLKERVIAKSLSGLPLAHLAAAFEKLGDKNSAKVLWDKAITFTDYKQQYNGDYGSEVRDVAWIMSLATQSQIAAQYQDLIYTLNDRLMSKRWFSTQERFALYQLALSFEQMNAEKWVVSIKSDIEKMKLISSKNKFAQLTRV